MLKARRRQSGGRRGEERRRAGRQGGWMCLFYTLGIAPFYTLGIAPGPRSPGVAVSAYPAQNHTRDYNYNGIVLHIYIYYNYIGSVLRSARTQRRIAPGKVRAGACDGERRRGAGRRLPLVDDNFAAPATPRRTPRPLEAGAAAARAPPAAAPSAQCRRSRNRAIARPRQLFAMCRPRRGLRARPAVAACI